MQIEYLKKMEQHSRIGSLKIEGFSEQTIKKLEMLQGVQLPKAYREFLFLGGKMDNFMTWEGGSSVEEALEIQQATVKKLGDADFTIPHPFWNFADQDRGEVFLFFYLNDGENPPVYICDRVAYFPEEGFFNEFVRQNPC